MESLLINQVVDLEVSKTKFLAEVTQFKKAELFHRERGVILLKEAFPVIELGFCAYRVRPLVMTFAVRLDFTNYDLDPISVKFIDAVTGIELVRNAVPLPFNRMIKKEAKEGEPTTTEVTSLLAAHPPQNIPFLCLPGVREYHQHPFHSNDPWLDHRGKGEGTLGFIIDQLVIYGTQPIAGVLPSMVQMAALNAISMKVQFNGFVFINDKVPE